MARSSTVETLEVRVLDSDGTPLTTAQTRIADDEAVILAEVEDPEILLNYYFGRGERLVVMELRDSWPPRTVEGTLETWWIASERRWQVYVDRPLVTLGLGGAAEPESVGGRR